MCFRESEKHVGFMRLHYAHPGPTRTRAPRANSSHGHPSATGKEHYRFYIGRKGISVQIHVFVVHIMYSQYASCWFHQKLLQIYLPTRGKLQQITIKMNVPTII